ncbi:28S ribosomal protein S27, mitochondrial [Bagarius yarrelli]|uniref:28S ribosomal protein S27, mitochondrial n=1 Tax=Bagarius yarrelli TaxID=175774 RepID=A0A556V7M3_BAGYA|nr:28S ribosomal protein S27, mitochondrial [Bagarius yarrelli]
MDKTYEKKFPVSSLTISRVQFGMFPDEFTFNILIDSYLKDEDYKGACSVVEEVMFQEAFDSSTTQILSLFALSKYLATKPECSWQMERHMGAALLLAGLKQENSVGLSAQLLGHALIGKVEITRGIHAVFHNMPLMWTPGYLKRGLAVMERVCNDAGHLKLCKESLDSVQMILQDLMMTPASEKAEEENAEIQTVTVDDDDELERAKLPQYMARFKELNEQLQTQGKVETRSLDTLVSVLAEDKLRTCEEQDLSQYEKKVQAWETERLQLVQREEMMKQKVKQERMSIKSAQAVQ